MLIDIFDQSVPQLMVLKNIYIYNIYNSDSLNYFEISQQI